MEPVRTPDLSAGSDEHVEDLAAAYALDALEPDERERVEFHIRFCPRCAAAVDRDLRTTGMLPFIVAGTVTPPADLKASIFTRINHVTRAEAAASVQAAASAYPTEQQTLPSSRPAAALPSQEVVVPAALAAQKKRGLAWFGSVLSVPLMGALIVTGFWGASMRDQITQQESRINALSAQVANFGSGATTLQLSPGRAQPQAEGQLVLGADEKSGMVSVDLNTDSAAGPYAVWAVNSDGELQPIAQFTVDGNGRGDAQVRLSEPFSSYEAVQIQPVGTEGKVNGRTVVLTSSYPNLGSTGSELDSMP